MKPISFATYLYFMSCGYEKLEVAAITVHLFS